MNREDNIYLFHSDLLEYWLIRITNKERNILKNMSRNDYAILKVIDENDPFKFAYLITVPKSKNWNYKEIIASEEEVDVLVIRSRDKSSFIQGYLINVSDINYERPNMMLYRASGVSYIIEP